MRYLHPLLAALACALLVAAPVSAAGSVRISGVNTADAQVHATVVTSTPSTSPPVLQENGKPVYGLTAENLGRAKSVVLALDRSRSMEGEPLANAVAAARAFISAKPQADRISVVSFATKSVRLTDFSTATIDADAALRTVVVDPVQGTTLYDGLVLAAQSLAVEPLQGRVIVVVTDGNETRSNASLDDAIAAAHDANAAVYVVAIESDQFTPDLLRKLAADTGGRYYGAASSEALSSIYASIAEELKRTWRVSYYTSARAGDQLRVTATFPGIGEGVTEVTLPGESTGGAAGGSLLPDFVFEHGLGAALLTLIVGASVLVATALALTTPRGARLRKRLEPHLGQPKQHSSKNTARDRLAAAEGMLSATERALGHLQVWRKLHRLIDRADVPLRTVEVVYISAGAGVLFGLLAVAVIPSSLAFVCGLALGALAPTFVLSFKAKRRASAMENQLPDILITIAASLKAGHSFRQGLQAVVDEDQEPASKEFGRVLTETRLGRPMDDALDEMSQRVGSKNLDFVITAVTIQRQVGGSLAGIFDMVAETVRNRQQFARKIKGLTAMGRMSAYVLIGIPFFIAGMLTLVNREFMEPLYHTSAGHKLIGLALVMMLFGTLILRKIVSFKG